MIACLQWAKHNPKPLIHDLFNRHNLMMVGRYCYPYLTDEDIEAQRKHITCPRSYSSEIQSKNLSPGSLAPE